MKLIKPKKLKAGDRVAAVTLSWGGPGVFPERYTAGKKQFEQAFGLKVVETAHALADPDWIYNNPKARADDLMSAFEDDSISGIISTIGGEESIRLLPYLDLDVISKHPKVLVGYSDTTVTHLACFKAGLSSFYGPAFMSGFAENGGMHAYLEDSFRRTVFDANAIGEVKPNIDGWTVEHLDWSNPDNQKKPRALTPCTGWNFLQGEGVHTGHLIGGCFEVLEWLRGTPVWPTPKQWRGAILFLETSEEAPPPSAIVRALRAYAAEGVLSELSGILFGRPGGNIEPSKFQEYDEAIIQVVRKEQQLNQLPIITGMDFGHTDPFFTIPYGIRAEIDCKKQTLSLVEGAVID